MEEKKCKHCAMMIPAEAKICPHCRKSVPRTISNLVSIAVIIFVIGMCIANIPDTSKTKSTSAPESQIALTEKGQRIKSKNPAWANKVCNTIGEKKISIGMTRDQVIAAWGRPQRINTSTHSWGTHEQWVYDMTNFVYFRNDVMESLQQSK